MKFYITTPIYYVNDVPHIGHAYTTIAADIIARRRRLLNDEVFFLTGTDEHGAKIAQAAQQQNKTPQQLCDNISECFKTSWADLGIKFDGFIRTTDVSHIKAVQTFLQTLFDKGHIYKSKYEGNYCVGCEKFIKDEELTPDGCCPDHKQKPVRQSEENYFFKLSTFRDALLERLTNTSHPQFISVLPEERRNEVIGKLKIALEDISISRTSIDWGIPLPFDKTQTAYVWIDALLNYITAAGYDSNGSNFKKWWPADLHLMAKDILWFHSVIWPAMLMAAELPLPKKIFSHGFFTINGEKMSKTLGNVIRPADLIQKFGVDASRYLTVSLFPFGADGDISWTVLQERYNVDLANNLGNLVSRTTAMMDKYFGGAIPDPKGASKLNVEGELKDLDKLFEQCSFHLIIGKILKAVDSANRFIESSAPWKLAKEKDPLLNTVMFDLIRAIGIISLHLLPFMPEKSSAIWQQLGDNRNCETAAKELFLSGTVANFPSVGAKTSKNSILFPRIEPNEK